MGLPPFACIILAGGLKSSRDPWRLPLSGPPLSDCFLGGNNFRTNHMSEATRFDEDVGTAVVLIRNGHSREAIPILDRVIESDPDHCRALRERGLAKKFCGDHAAAIADFSTVIRRHPNDPEAYVDRADTRARGGDLQGAIEDYSAAISSNSRYSFAYLHRGRLRVVSGDLPGAISDFTATMANDRMGPLSGLLNRGPAKHRLGDLAGAIDDLTEAMRLERGGPIFAPLFRGRVWLDAGNYEAAIADFTAAIEAFPELTNAYRHRADAKALAGDREGAETDLSTYTRLGGRDLPAYE
jgi:predicted Zn-dependent protease